MTTQIKVLRENMIRTLYNINESNVQIADVAFSRKRLLEALKLLNYPGTEVLTLNYGKMSFREYNGESVVTTMDNEPCIQFNCDHQVMRFLNRPIPSKRKLEPEIKSLHFIEHSLDVKPVLVGIPIDVKELLSALQFVMPCVAIEQSRPVLNCVLFNTDTGEDDTLTLVSADGFRLGIAKLTVKGLPKNKVLIHSSDVAKLVTFLKAVKPTSSYTHRHKAIKEYPEVYLSYQADNSIKFSVESNSITFTRQEGTFPKYEQLIPQTGTHIEFIASEMLQAVKAIMPTAKDGSGIIRLNFAREYPAGKITLSARSEERGDVSVECTAKVQADCKIASNGKYLKDFLSQCKDNVIDLFLTTPSSPMVFHDMLERCQVLMPMFAQWDTPFKVETPEPVDMEDVDCSIEGDIELEPEEVSCYASASKIRSIETEESEDTDYSGMDGEEPSEE